eukprot:scaffold2785_cov291-Pinguiococcus_pyrenoidosus.AAC.9
MVSTGSRVVVAHVIRVPRTKSGKRWKPLPHFTGQVRAQRLSSRESLCRLPGHNRLGQRSCWMSRLLRPKITMTCFSAFFPCGGRLVFLKIRRKAPEVPR